MRILANGNVGIGTTAPGYALDVNGVGKFVTDLRLNSSTSADGAVLRSTALRDFQVITNVGVGSTVGLYQSAAGNVGIGTTSPTAILHLKAGTATANTAPLKFTSGTLNTTTGAGAVEFLTDAYYGTITTGATRKQFAFIDSIITSLSATSPIFYNNTTGVISSQAATASMNGYLTSTDWNIFSGKQAAIDTGERITGIHAGKLKDISLSDDYLYICVVGGDVGTAIWKKLPLIQSI